MAHLKKVFQVGLLKILSAFAFDELASWEVDLLGSGCLYARIGLKKSFGELTQHQMEALFNVSVYSSDIKISRQMLEN